MIQEIQPVEGIHEGEDEYIEEGEEGEDVNQYQPTSVLGTQRQNVAFLLKPSTTQYLNQNAEVRAASKPAPTTTTPTNPDAPPPSATPAMQRLQHGLHHVGGDPSQTTGEEVAEMQNRIKDRRQEYYQITQMYPDMKFPNLPQMAPVDKIDDVIMRCKAMITHRNGGFADWATDGLFRLMDMAVPNVSHDMEDNRDVYRRALADKLFLQNSRLASMARDPTTQAGLLLSLTILDRYRINKNLSAKGLDPRKCAPGVRAEQMSDAEMLQHNARSDNDSKLRQDRLKAVAMQRARGLKRASSWMDNQNNKQRLDDTAGEGSDGESSGDDGDVSESDDESDEEGDEKQLKRRRT